METNFSITESRPLAQAMQRFTAVTQTLADQDLEQAWSWGDYHEGVRFAFFRTYEELRALAGALEGERQQQSLPANQRPSGAGGVPRCLPGPPGGPDGGQRHGC